ncbi:MAG TPA: nucleotide sugar dehydrogenase [Anaerolineales bacterium]|jgi:GDP-mannose 6-dehydrogenase|nr:nucleotide sugar dehydrogenase [Anaerolineales bacterium]
MATISVFGLGYVGCVLAACLAERGHDVIGVDVNTMKVEMVNRGESPLIEPGLGELIHKNVSAGRLRTTQDTEWAVLNSDLSFICVGTPSNANGSLNTDYVTRVCEDIGNGLAKKNTFHIVVVRSTLLPGTTEEMLQPILENSSGKTAGIEFGIGYNPEFLREGTSIKDFFDPPYTVIGADDEKVVAAVKQVYSMLDAPVIEVPVKVAEMVKYVNNAFHALKVTFANEIGSVCKQQNIDSHQVMEIFCMDRKLNLSPYYLKPGFAFGGSCLPKDLRALLYHGRKLDMHLPVLEAILPSNDLQVAHAYQLIRQTGCKKVGVLGLSFKEGTDDLRESPMVELIEHLVGKGYQVMVYDRNVSLSKLHGANRAYIEHEIPHISQLMSESIDDVIENSDVVVVGNKAEGYLKISEKLREDHKVIDLVRVKDGPYTSNGHYQGIGW